MGSFLLDRRAFFTFAIMAVLVLFYRELVTVFNPITLFYDEAYYLSWAQNPDWGYYSKPPMVGWLIALTTGLFGNGEWAVKLAAPTLYVMTSLVIFKLMLFWFNRNAAFFAGCIFLFMPLVSLNSLFITTDAPQLFFWTTAIYCFARAMDSDSWKWWILAGLVGGCGLLSKYTFVLLPVGFLVFAVWTEQGKKVLQNRKFWFACGLAVLCLLPNLYWNYLHDFISFQHTSEISKLDQKLFNPDKLADFLSQQFLVLGPIFLGLLLFFMFSKREKPVQVKLLWCFFYPTIILISLQALLARANMNWAAAAYVSASMLLGYYLATLNWRRWFVAGLAVNIVLMLAFYHFKPLTDTLGIERKWGNDPFKRITGWPELVRTAQPYIDQYPDHKLASDSRNLLAYFGYYLAPQDFTGVALDGNDHVGHHYDLKYHLPQSDHQQFMFVSEHWQQQDLQSFFAHVRQIGEISHSPYQNLTRTVRLFSVSGYIGDKNGLITSDIPANDNEVLTK